MSKIYKVGIQDENYNALLNNDGEISASNYLNAAPKEAREAIDWLVDIYDRTAWGLLNIIFQQPEPLVPWACIFLDREYAVAAVARDTLIDGCGIQFANYSVIFNPKHPNEQLSIGYIWVKRKADLAQLIDKSVLWAECWRVLADADADKHYISILDPLPKDWSYQNENSNVLNIWHEVKAHSSAGKVSNEKH